MLLALLHAGALWLAPLWCAAAAGGGAWLLLKARPNLRGTTLTAPWAWSIVALWTLAVVEALIAWATLDRPPTWAGPLRLAAACAFFCPPMALLGAKRPQDRAWTFVVVTLWGVLALPAAQSLILHRASVELGWLRGAFMLTLLALGVANWLPTRFAPAAVLAGGGHFLLLADFLVFDEPQLEGAGSLAGITLLTAAVGAAWLLARRRRRVASPLEALWLDFRDQYGALWALRVAERMNVAAGRHRWNLTFTWRGIRYDASGERLAPPAQNEAQMRRVFASLLRRFVSYRWIDRRLESIADDR